MSTGGEHMGQQHTKEWHEIHGRLTSIIEDFSPQELIVVQRFAATLRTQQIPPPDEAHQPTDRQ